MHTSNVNPSQKVDDQSSTTIITSSILGIYERIEKGLKLPPRQMNNLCQPVSPRIKELYDAIGQGDRQHVQELVKCFNVHDLNSDPFNYGIPLAYAAKKGQHEILLDLAEAGASDYKVDRFNQIQGATALYAAAVYGQEESIRLLLAMGANPSVKGQDSSGIFMYVLHSTVREGHLACVKLLVEASPSPCAYVNEQDQTGIYGYSISGTKGSPLSYAFISDRGEIMEYLLEKGADLKLAFPEDSEEELLNAAAIEGHLEVMKLLVKRGVNPNGKFSDDGATTLDIAKIYRHQPMITFLEGLNVSSNEEFVRKYRSQLALEALTSVCSSGYFEPKYGFSNYTECFEALLRDDVNTIVDESTKQTLLHLAASQIAYEHNVRRLLIEKLLSSGADPKQKDGMGRTALEIAQDQTINPKYPIVMQERILVNELLSNSLQLD